MTGGTGVTAGIEVAVAVVVAVAVGEAVAVRVAMGVLVTVVLKVAPGVGVGSGPPTSSMTRATRVPSERTVKVTWARVPSSRLPINWVWSVTATVTAPICQKLGPMLSRGAVMLKLEAPGEVM